MFQFAAGVALSMRHGVGLRLDASRLSTNWGCTPRAYGLDQFKLVEGLLHEGHDAKAPFKLVVSARDRLLELKGILKRDNSPRYIESFIDYPGNCILDGYWQSPRYFEDYAEQVRDAFTWKAPLDGENLEYLAWIQGDVTASIHFRRGDYANNPQAYAIHGGICGANYYRAAIEHLRTAFGTIRFAVFSDDISWVRENFPELSDAVFVEGNTGDRSSLDMRLMSACEHHVIANSTFSWWGAWLNPSASKIVIAPRRWMNKPGCEDIVPAEWRCIQA